MHRYSVISLIVFMAVISIHTISSASPEISNLLRECQEHLQANRLTSGRGGTALDCYKEVLEKEPGNTDALKGLKQIEARYTYWAKRALEKGQENKAKRYSDNLRKVQNVLQAQTQPQVQPQTPHDNASSSSLVEEAGIVEENTSQTQPAKETSQTQPAEETSQTQPVEEEEEEEPLPKEAQIVDVGQIYELINTTDCLIWPSLDKQKKGGKNGWDSFYPKKGDTGIIVEEMKHCHFEDIVYILEIGEYYVPISSIGIEIISEEKSTETSE